MTWHLDAEDLGASEALALIRQAAVQIHGIYV